MNTQRTRAGNFLREVFTALRRQFTAGIGVRRRPVNDPASLRKFLTSRASHVAQTSLFGYLRTRAGTRFPELFSDDAFRGSINIAKWQLWLSCLSDLCVYTGGLVALRTGHADDRLRALMNETLETILAETGIPDDAGPQFAESTDRIRSRIRGVDWSAVEDNEGCFTESPHALVQWAPIIDELKQMDSEIVINSVRFRWQEVRRDLRAALDADALMADGSQDVTRIG